MTLQELYGAISTGAGVFKPDNGSKALAEAALLYPGKFLDVGTGTGFVSLALILNGREGAACDISANALRCAGNNFRRFGVPIEPFRSDLFSNVDGVFDLIIFNPTTSPGESGFFRFLKNMFKLAFPSFLLLPVQKFLWSTNSAKRRAFLNKFIRRSETHLNIGGVLLLNILEADLIRLREDNKDVHVSELKTTEFTKVVEIKFVRNLTDF